MVNKANSAIESTILSLFAQTLTSFPALSVAICEQQDWQAFSVHTPIKQPEYQWFIGLYHHSVNLNNFPQAYLLNFIIYQDQQPTAIWRLNLAQSGEATVVTTNSSPISAPIIATGASKKTTTNILKSCLHFLVSVAERFKLKELVCQGIDGWSLNQEWSKLWLQAGANIKVSHECFTDLSQNIDEYLKKRSKGCKSDIKKALKLWHFEIHDQLSDKQLKQFQDFHRHVAGRVTRDNTTWEAQQRFTNNGESFVIFIYSDKQLIGCAQFTYSAHTGAYAIAAYERELFQYPIAHGAQILAMKKMQSMGITQYYLGARCYPGSNEKPDVKAQSIGKFKASFASSIELNQTLTLTISKGEEK
ncbi:hypothetical protein [Motilimonas pumila]|uniref:Uncharacterized protein n=1 Tax=Motilimonas pumila TaxID=2303987 RepID=A0A418YGL6_9GAMM|nr:hypothetical protein [Motilimonas pumila]RJG49008.1 hypothetical protein D1Z90_06460 [Motilimonas pumila]